MAWTYDVTQLQSASPGTWTNSTIGARYQIRLLLQDNQTTRQLLQDEEIDWFQTQEMNVYMAAAKCCRSLVARAGNVKSKRVGDLSLTYDPLFYRQLALELETRGSTYQQVYVGGTSISDKLAEQKNVDARLPLFFIGLGNFPSAGQPSPGNTSSQAINNPNSL